MSTFPVCRVVDDPAKRRWVQIWLDNAPLRTVLSLDQYLADPAGAILTVLFPPEPASEQDQDAELSTGLVPG